MYLDTSALVKLYVEEQEGCELVRQAIERSERIVTSTIAYAEARAALARKQREGLFTLEELRRAISDLDGDWRTYERLDVSDYISHRAGELAELHSLRGYDSVHLASAVRASERVELLRFLAFDERLNDAARGADLLVCGSAITLRGTGEMPLTGRRSRWRCARGSGRSRCKRSVSISRAGVSLTGATSPRSHAT